jgi:kinesin family protein 1
MAVSGDPQRYGQTGAGKSYSMVGYGTDKGIVPLVLAELFERMSSNKDPGVKYLVEASMMEVSNAEPSACQQSHNAVTLTMRMSQRSAAPLADLQREGP